MATSKNILVVEDNESLREVLCDVLDRHYWHSTGVSCAEDMDVWLAKKTFSIVLLDLNLPGEDGLSIAQRLRKSLPNLGLLLLTARNELEDKLAGYSAGADIYLSKPVAHEELLAALRSLHRRLDLSKASDDCLTLSTNSLKLKGSIKECSITSPDAMILKSLASAPDQQIEYWQLMEHLGLDHGERGKAALEVRIVRLRKKMFECSGLEVGIKSVRGYGYQLTQTLQIIDS